MNSNHKSRIQKSRNKLTETVGCSPRESPTVTWQKVDTGGEMFVIIFPKWFLPSGAPYIIMRHLSHFLDFHSSNCHRVASASLKRYNSFNSIDRRKSSQGIFSWAHFVFCKFKIFGRVFLVFSDVCPRMAGLIRFIFTLVAFVGLLSTVCISGWGWTDNVVMEGTELPLSPPQRPWLTQRSLPLIFMPFLHPQTQGGHLQEIHHLSQEGYFISDNDEKKTMLIIKHC